MRPGCCVFCDTPINVDQDYRRVIGWEKRRPEGGTNSVALREPQDEWACQFCIDKQKRGLPAGQGRLI